MHCSTICCFLSSIAASTSVRWEEVRFVLPFHPCPVTIQLWSKKAVSWFRRLVASFLGPAPIPGWSMWDFWVTEWHRDNILFWLLRFPPVVHNHLLNYHRRYMISAIDNSINITRTRGGTKVMLPFFTTIPVVIKFTYITGASFTKLRLFFHKVSSIINTLFPPLRETLYACRAKLSAERQSFSRAPCFSSSSSGSPWSAPFREPKKMKAEGC